MPHIHRKSESLFGTIVTATRRTIGITGVVALALVALLSIACVDFERLEIEPTTSHETDDGVVVEVMVSNRGDAQEITSVALGLVGVDQDGNTWTAIDECSTLDGQTVTEAASITGTICFPFEKLSEETGALEAHMPRGTTIVYIIATDNLFVGDGDKFFIIPIGATTVSGGEGPTPAEPPAPVTAPQPTSVTVQVWMWRSIADPDLLYVSTRAGDEGPWELTGPLDMSGESRSGNYNQSGIVEIEVAIQP